MKLFTVEEANALLPQLRRLLAALERSRAELSRLEPEAQQASERASESGGTRHGGAYAAALISLLNVTQDILGLGVEIKDFEKAPGA